MRVLDDGPFFHGTKADLKVGDSLTAGFTSNYRDGVVMNHIYFTALAKGAGRAAETARGNGRPRVYVVEPSGEFDNDPNRHGQEISRQSDAFVSEQPSPESRRRARALGTLRPGVRPAAQEERRDGQGRDHELTCENQGMATSRPKRCVAAWPACR